MQILPKFGYGLKSAYLIIHVTQNKALEVPILNSELEQFQPEFTAINEKNPKQLWIIDEREPGFVELVNGFTDKVLTAEDNGMLSIRKGKGKFRQYWILAEVTSGSIRISNAKYRQLFLSFDTIHKRPVLKNNSPDVWQFRQVSKNQDLNQTCFIYDPRDQKMIDVPQSSTKQEVTIYVWKPNFRFNQRWRLYKAGEVYIIKSYINGLNLDVYQQEFVHEQKIIQYHSTGGTNQLWMLEKIEKSTDEFRIYCFADPEFELGHNTKRLVLHKGKTFVWKIQGYIPD